MFFPRARLLHLPVLLFAAALLLAFVSVGWAEDTSPSAKAILGEGPVNFTAKYLSHDDKAQTVTAIGDVELVQGARILRADKIVYELSKDRATAIGNVSLLNEKGDVHFAEYVVLHNQMKDGLIQGLLTLLADGSRFTAVEARREDGGLKTTMTEATYTMCKVCEIDPQPLWQVKADRVTHDAKEKTIKYKNARMEFLGVPVFYSPILSHPDPTQKRKSGFLRPTYGWTTALGSHLKAGYYHDIAPHRDATLWVQPSSLAGTLVEGEWRERFEKGRLQVSASTANSDRKELDGRVENDLQRGHVFAEGRYDFSDTWRGGFNVARASDSQYLRLYEISKEDVLTNQLYGERFSGRDYSRVSAYSFQDVRLGVRPDQPDIFPIAEHTAISEPGSLWGGRSLFNVSALSLTRTASGQDVQRGSAAVEWERRGATSGGIVNVLHLDARGDAYNVQNSSAAVLNPALDKDPTIARGLATAGLTSSYPLVRSFARAQAVIEPVAGVNLSPKASSRIDETPNEDSVDIQFDANNLFEQNRFPGIDRQEDGGRANYGLKAGLYGDDGRYGQAFLGRSIRFYGDTIFPRGSGLENAHSDLVGQIKAGLAQYLDADYRFQFDNETLSAKRHEVQMGGGNDRFRLDTRYLYTKALAGTGFNESRQQVLADGSLNLTKHWTWRASGLMDFGDEPGLRNATTGFDYGDECFTFAIQGSRNVASEASGDNETKLLLRIGFKTIGEFSGPKIPLGGTQAKPAQ